MNIDPDEECRLLRESLRAFEQAVSQDPDHLPAGSRWTTCQHAEHAAKALRRTLRAIAVIERGASRTDLAPDVALSEAALELLQAERIPAGSIPPRAAPAAVQPEAAPDPATVRLDLTELESALEKPPVLAARGQRPHPLLGPLGAAQWLRFARIHTHHHLQLVSST